jgi:tetrahydromethanopterin:alpha-L-glutamate ligase
VDLLRDRDGKLGLLEVNSMPGWRGLQRTQADSVAQRIVAGLLARVR